MLKFPKLMYANKFSLPSLPLPGTFNGTTILITGGTSGLGLATAVHFLNLGASKVIITARTLSKGTAAKVLIESQIRVPNPETSIFPETFVFPAKIAPKKSLIPSSWATGSVEIRLLDMGTFAAIKEFADVVKQELKSVDYVLLNAGVLATSFRMSQEGYEETILINCLGTALLAILLLPWLKVVGEGKAHMGIVTSGLHRGVDITPGKWPQKEFFTTFSKEENWAKYGSSMYAISKLLIQYCVNEIAKLAIGPDGTPQVIVNPMCPGLVKSGLARDYRTNPVLGLFIDGFSNVAMKSTEGGARTPILAALTTKEENGKHISDQSYEEYKVAVQKNVLGPEGQRMQAQVWKEALAILEEKIPGVRQIVDSAARVRI